MLAQSPQASDGALDECDNELTWIGVTAKPWPQESRRAWRDDCIAREMRKPDRTKFPAVAALLLSSELRLLVRHGHSNGGGRFLRPDAVVDPSRRCSPLKGVGALTMGAVA